MCILHADFCTFRHFPCTHVHVCAERFFNLGMHGAIIRACIRRLFWCESGKFIENEADDNTDYRGPPSIKFILHAGDEHAPGTIWSYRHEAEDDLHLHIQV